VINYRAARVITQSPFETSFNLLLAMLKWEKLSLRREKQNALIMITVNNANAAVTLLEQRPEKNFRL